MTKNMDAYLEYEQGIKIFALRIKIEQIMSQLSKLQKEYTKLTGQPHKMPAYTAVPVHLQNIK